MKFRAINENDNIKAGDTLYFRPYFNGTTVREVTVTRTTKKFIFVGNAKFRLDGSMPNDDFGLTQLYIAIEEQAEPTNDAPAEAKPEEQKNDAPAAEPVKPATKSTKAKNLFKGVEITFSTSQIDNRERKERLASIGFSNTLPDFENRIEYVEMAIAMSHGNFKFEREFTRRENGDVTLYVSAEGVVPVALRETLTRLLRDNTITSVTYGSMKADATFKPSKAKR